VKVRYDNRCNTILHESAGLQILHSGGIILSGIFCAGNGVKPEGKLPACGEITPLRKI
jgi:hypothetical protein